MVTCHVELRKSNVTDVQKEWALTGTGAKRDRNVLMRHRSASFANSAFREQKQREDTPVCKYTMWTTTRRKRISKPKGEGKKN